MPTIIRLSALFIANYNSLVIDHFVTMVLADFRPYAVDDTWYLRISDRMPLLFCYHGPCGIDYFVTMVLAYL